MAADATGNVDAAHEVLNKSNIRDGSITAEFERIGKVLRFFLFCFVYLCLFIILEVRHGAAALTHFSLTHIAATLLTHCTAVVLTHSIAILIALPHWCSIYSGQSCRLFFS